MRMKRILTIAVAALLVLAVPARADVLVDGPVTPLQCGKSMRLGVWYRDFPNHGHRDVRVSVRNAAGRIVFRRHVTAPTHWLYWHYKPKCGTTYSVRYTTFYGPETFKVRVRA
jgi:hypothetical protein